MEVLLCILILGILILTVEVVLLRMEIRQETSRRQESISINTNGIHANNARIHGIYQDMVTLRIVTLETKNHVDSFRKEIQWVGGVHSKKFKLKMLPVMVPKHGKVKRIVKRKK